MINLCRENKEKSKRLPGFPIDLNCLLDSDVIVKGFVPALTHLRNNEKKTKKRQNRIIALTSGVCKVKNKLYPDGGHVEEAYSNFTSCSQLS